MSWMISTSISARVVALEELGDDYEEDEIRLVRIKFLSELAN